MNAVEATGLGAESSYLKNPRKWALLTGAGFSKNWGYPVAQEVWADLISDPSIHDNREVRRALLAPNGFNFEEVLFRAQKGEFGEAGKSALQDAIVGIFNRLQTRLNNEEIGIENLAMSLFATCFMGRNDGETGLIFTLNQDMLFEATCGAGHLEGGILRPGFEKTLKDGAVLRAGCGVPKPRLGADPTSKVKVDALRQTPAEGFVLPQGRTHYLKLHGSWDWMDPGDDWAMVMGGGKEEFILQRPLLFFYQQVFREFLIHGERKLLVVGYGFGDQHINRWLQDAIQNHGLQIHVWDTCPPSVLHDRLQNGWAAIWQGLCGYTQVSLREVLTLPHVGEFRRFCSESKDLLERILGEKLGHI